MVYTTKGVFQSTRPVRGATSLSVSVCVGSYSFNPRAPCGARHVATIDSFRCVRVSIHAPRAGRDNLTADLIKGGTLFQSTRPVRGATSYRRSLPSCGCSFQSTRPVRGATIEPTYTVRQVSVSIHAPRAGRDTVDHIGN